MRSLDIILIIAILVLTVMVLQDRQEITRLQARPTASISQGLQRQWDQQRLDALWADRCSGPPLSRPIDCH